MAEEQKVTVETSKKGKLNKNDYWRSTLTTLYVSLATIILQFLDAVITAFTTSGSIHFDWANLLLTLKIAVATWLGDTLRRLLKDSVTVIKVTPPIKGLTDDEGAGGSGTENPGKPGTP